MLDGLGVDRTHLAGHSYGAWIALTFALRNPDRVNRLTLIDPTDCFTGLRLPYIARALPSLLRPSRERTLSFLRWETQGLPVDPQWLDLAALAAEQPTARPVRPRRPRQQLHTDLTVVVADRSKAHNPDELARRAAAAGATVVRVETATHHSLPALHADELVKALSA